MTRRPDRSLALPTRVLRLATVVVSAALVLAVSVGPAVAGGASQDVDPEGEWPLRPEPEVVAPFDPPDSPFGSGHRGVDLAGSPGQPVHAALPGTVTYAGPLAGIGVVVVGHGATRTTYQPVAAGVAVGDVVADGTVLGTLSPVGSHCPPRACLHWGWIRGDTYLDPLRLVGAGPVRLLPLWRDSPAGVTPRSMLRSPYDSWRPVLDLLRLLGAA